MERVDGVVEAAAAAEEKAAAEKAAEVKPAEEKDVPKGPVAEEAEEAVAKPSGAAEPPARTEEESEADPEVEPEAGSGAAPVAESAPEPDRAAEPVAEAAAEPAVEPTEANDRNAGRRRLKAALWPPRLSRGQLVVALLLFSLGLALAIQVRSTNDHHNQLRGARQEDLVRILDELDSRQQRLQQEKAELEQSLGKLENSSNQAKEAQEQTRKKETELGVLAGTVKATGPGIVLTVDDPQGQVKADMLLDTLQELRAAGAEAIQINDVRVVVNTNFTDVTGGGVQIDGKKVAQPYRFTVVGNPQDLTPALNIPGGVVRTLESHQARATITTAQKVVVDAVVDLRTPQYAKPASK
ncbi:DUF881 domain-containing protein [Streptomyces sp. SP17BM10]|uniref:DUF881 domain-containing protein n=1 Tax=Streptomyces sp. SP17BM10 TaxID=3002530 RepID=UPI002E75B476|nr:DUF881 domain-containing protein [Streptomyces sp. SP17BM10]MEE1781981.1 DUF881 domain-containing protein [Streptomyces sp. SP17BM10]